MALIDSIIGAESGGDANAKNPNSSATGAGQFISGTWLDTIKAARPDIAEGKTDDQLLALRSDPALSREMTEAYAAQNGATLAKAGHPVTPGNTYLAHFAGPQGAVSVLSADPSTPVSAILRPDAIKSNPFLQGMTAGDLRAWADRKMGSGQPSQATPASPAMAPPAVRVASAIMGQPAPTRMPVTTGAVASQIMGAPQQQEAQASPALFEQSAAAQPPALLQLPQMQAPRKIDFLKLRAALQQNPYFKQG